MNYHQLLHQAKEQLQKAGKPEGDARVLLFYIKGWSAAEYLLRGSEEVPAEEAISYQALIEKRLSGVPVQEMTGYQNFYGYEIAVNPQVLTPRPETELLVELALAEMAKYQKPRVLDLCTGSGCIAIALALECPAAEVTAVDISPQALDTARKNAAANGADKIRWICSDLFAELRGQCFDIIISNPPYIPSADILELEREVTEFDPLLALDGGADGLVFYRRIAEQGGELLRERIKESDFAAKVFMEIGDGQGMEIAGLFRANSWQNVEVRKDYAGRERMVIAEKGEEIM